MIFGYCRVSTDQQVEEGISLDEQQRRIEGRCLEQGWELAKIFIERGVSGSVPFAERPEGGRLMQILQPGDIVISPKLDRCFRSSLDALQTIEELKRRRVSLWLLDLGGDVSGNGISEMMLTILAAVAQFERFRIGERIRDAKRHMRNEGRHQGGKRPFGWQPAPRRRGDTKAPMLVPMPAEQEAVADMVRMRDEGKTLRAIAAAIQDRHSLRVSPEVVRQVLKRQAEASAS